MKISKFLSDKEAVEKWLNDEQSDLEKQDIYLSYWFHGEGVGITVTYHNCGEFHSMKNGLVTMHVEEGMGDELFSTRSTATDEKTLFNLFNNFKKKVCEENT